MFDDNAVGYYTKITPSEVTLKYKQNGEVVRELEIRSGQVWEVEIEGQTYKVEIEEMWDSMMSPVMAYVKTDSELFKQDGYRIDNRPAYPIGSISDGKLIFNPSKP